MTRPLRLHLPNTAYHLFARGDNKAAIFHDDDDYAHFLEVLSRALQRFTVQCLAYCLLSNHYHLLVVPGPHSVSRLMHYVNSCYCRRFNKKHRRVGHVLQGRFGSRLVEDGGYLITVLRYIALNPVAAKRVQRADDWPWSSHPAVAGLCPAPGFLSLGAVWQAFNCRTESRGRARYLTYMAQDASAEELERVLLFGGELLAGKVDPLLEPHRADRSLTHAERYATRPPLDAIFADADSVRWMMQAAAIAFDRHAYTLAEIGSFVQRTPSSVSKWVRRGREAPRTAPERGSERSMVTPRTELAPKYWT